MSLLKRLVSVSGPLIRVFIGAGSVALLIVGLRQGIGKSVDDANVRRATSGPEEQRRKG